MSDHPLRLGDIRIEDSHEQRAVCSSAGGQDEERMNALGSSGGRSSSIANGLRLNASCLRSSSKLNSRLLALAAHARAKFGKSSSRQNSARRRAFHRLSEESWDLPAVARRPDQGLASNRTR